MNSGEYPHNGVQTFSGVCLSHMNNAEVDSPLRSTTTRQKSPEHSGEGWCSRQRQDIKYQYSFRDLLHACHRFFYPKIFVVFLICIYWVLETPSTPLFDCAESSGGSPAAFSSKLTLIFYGVFTGGWQEKLQRKSPATFAFLHTVPP